MPAYISGRSDVAIVDTGFVPWLSTHHNVGEDLPVTGAITSSRGIADLKLRGKSEKHWRTSYNVRGEAEFVAEELWDKESVNIATVTVWNGCNWLGQSAIGEWIYRRERVDARPTDVDDDEGQRI